MTNQERLEFVARNPGFERSRMYGHYYKDLSPEDLQRVEWLRLKYRSEAKRYLEAFDNYTQAGIKSGETK